MTKFKISYISDCIFVFILSFMLFYAPVSFFAKRRIASAIIAFFASVICLAAFIFISKKKHGELAVKKSEEEAYVDCRNFFLLSNDKTIENLVVKAFKKLKNQAVLSKNGIILPDGNRVFYKFSARPVGADEIITAYKSVPKGSSVIFVAIAFGQDAFDFVKNLGMRIKLIDFPQFYILLKENDCLPPASDKKNETPKLSVKTKLKYVFLSAFDKKKAKTFAFYGVLTLLLSRFVAFTIYYTTIGCLFLVYAVAIKFLAKTPKNDVV